MTSARGLYESTVQHMPVMERLRLAAFILNGVAIPAVLEMAVGCEESDQEATDLAKFLMEHAGASIQLDEKKPDQALGIHLATEGQPTVAPYAFTCFSA